MYPTTWHANRFDTGPFDKEQFDKLLENKGVDHRPMWATALTLAAILVLLLAR